MKNSIDENTAYEISRRFAAPQAALFHAVLNPATLKEIWGVSSISVDARPGGQARATFRIGEENWDFTITYQEVAPYDKLRWIVRFDRNPSRETHVALMFRPLADGSEVTVRMENFENAQECDANRQAWEQALNKLEAIVGK